MFNNDPNNQNRRPMNYETELDRRAARQTASTTIPIVLASAFIVAIMIGVFVMSGPKTETANNTGMSQSMASRVLSRGSGAGHPMAPAPAAPATTGSGGSR